MLVFKWNIIFFCKGIGKHCFIGKRASINKPKYLTLSDNVRIGNDTRLSFYDSFNGQKLNPDLTFGKNVYIGNRFTVLCADIVSIGENVLIASDVLITSENHGMDAENELPYSKQSLVTNKVVIENNVWIGEKVTILPGVTIGMRSIIGAGSVVTKDIPPYTIAVGSPAKVVKKYNFEIHDWISV